MQLVLANNSEWINDGLIILIHHDTDERNQIKRRTFGEQTRMRRRVEVMGGGLHRQSTYITFYIYN